MPPLPPDPLYGSGMYYLGSIIFAALAIIVVVAFVKQRNQRGHFDDE